MANPMIAAARAYWLTRVENRAKRIDRAATRLSEIAEREIDRAARLRKATGQRDASTSSPSRRRKSTRRKAANDGSHDRSAERPDHRSGNPPEDYTESGAIVCPMWADEAQGEFAFGVRWKVINGGREYFRRSISVEMFEDVIRALTELAARYANEERMPKVVRERMKAYFLFLKSVPDCVKEELASKTIHKTLTNGQPRPADKK